MRKLNSCLLDRGKDQIDKLQIKSTAIDSMKMNAVDHARNLKVIFHKHMSMEKQFNQISET